MLFSSLQWYSLYSCTSVLLIYFAVHWAFLTAALRNRRIMFAFVLLYTYSDLNHNVLCLLFYMLYNIYYPSRVSCEMRCFHGLKHVKTTNCNKTRSLQLCRSVAPDFGFTPSRCLVRSTRVKLYEQKNKSAD